MGVSANLIVNQRNGVKQIETLLEEGLGLKIVERGIGSCAHCGHAIINCYIVQIADGKRFGVGSDCIEKCGLPYAELTKLQKIERERQRVQRAERKAKKGNAARESIRDLIATYSETMAKMKHPKRDADSLLDYAKWTLERSSDGGILFALKTIQNELQKPKGSL